MEPGATGGAMERDYVKESARALSDLNMYHAVIALLESSLIDSLRQKTDQAIIRLCRIESSQCLRDYDRAYAKATGTIDRRGTYSRIRKSTT
jgi:hypothetical protein